MTSLEPHRQLSDGGAARELVGRVASSAATAFVLYVLAAGLSYLSQLAVARSIGVEGFGAYSYVVAWATVLAYVCALGFDVALLRFVPVYRQAGDWQRLKGVLAYAQGWALQLSGLIAGALGILFLIDPQFANPPVVAAAKPALVLVPILSLLWLRCAALRAFDVVVTAIAADRILREGGIIVLVMVAYALGIDIGAVLAVVFTVAASAAGLAVASVALSRAKPSMLRHAEPIEDASAWKSTALALVTLGATEAFFNRLGTLWLGWSGDTRLAGVYSVAFSISFFVALPRTAVNTLFAPTLAGIFARKNYDLAQHLITQSTVWSVCAAAFVATVLFVLAEPLLMLFGPDFAAGVSTLRILLAGQLIAAAAGSQLYVLTMTGNERTAARLLMVAVAICMVTTWLFAARWGIEGAALASTLSLVLWNVLMAHVIWRRLGLAPGLAALLVSGRTPGNALRPAAASAKAADALQTSSERLG